MLNYKYLPDFDGLPHSKGSQQSIDDHQPQIPTGGNKLNKDTVNRVTFTEFTEFRQDGARVGKCSRLFAAESSPDEVRGKVDDYY